MWLFPPSSVRHGTPLSFTSINLRILNAKQEILEFLKLKFRTRSHWNWIRTRRKGHGKRSHTHSPVSTAKESAKNGLAKNNKVTLIFFLLPRYFFSGFFSARSCFLRYFIFYFYFIFLLFNLTQFSVSWLRALSRSLHSTACQTDELHIAVQNASKLEIGSHYDATRSFIFHSSDFPPFCACLLGSPFSRRLSGHQRLATSKIQGLRRLSMQFLHASWVLNALLRVLTVDCHCHIPHRAPDCLESLSSCSTAQKLHREQNWFLFYHESV